MQRVVMSNDTWPFWLYKSISHMSVEHFAMASAGFFVLLASFSVQRKE